MDHWNEKESNEENLLENQPQLEWIFRVLSALPALSSKKTLYFVTASFSIVLIFSLCIALLPVFGYKNDDYEHSIPLLQTFLTALSILLITSAASVKSKKYMNSEKFLQEFFENFEIKNISENFTKSRRSRFSDYKILLKYNKDGETQIGYNLEYDNFFIYSSKEKIEEIARENNLEKFGNSSLWLGENCSGSYHERISQLREYIDFVEKNF